jgi:hypothetical protein
MNDIQDPFLSFDGVPKVALEEVSLAANSRVCIVAISDTCNRHSSFGNHISG